MKTNGFITRKITRLTEEKGKIENRIKRIDSDIVNLLRKATSLTVKRGYCSKNLDSINNAIDMLSPRLKCEEVRIAKATEIPTFY